MVSRTQFSWISPLILLISLVISLVVVVFPSFSRAQEYPTKPIELIAPFPPGGLGPLVASLVAEEVKKYFSKPMVVVHKPGAAGTIGSYYVAKAPADGYTLMLHAPSSITTAHLIQKFEFSVPDYDMVAGVAMAPMTLAVGSNAPWKNLTELIRYAKKNPGVVTCGNPGTHSSAHIYALIFEKITGIKLNQVPFKGSADSMTAVAGGHTMMAVRYPAEGEPLVETGKVRILSVLDTQRCKFYPNVPCSAEEGYSTLSLKSWRAVMAPKGVPKPILAKLEGIMKKITSDHALVEKAEKLKIGLEFKGSEDMKKDLQKEAKEIADLVKELDIKAQ
jgi:tripartite-type tricarboxylate transporter receptor subunit TctC